jgi:hypothetical protein
MRFEKCHGWRVSFRDPNDESQSFRDFTFAEASKIGEGVTTLALTQEQYRKPLR